MSEKGWRRAFADPIILQDGRTLKTIGDGARYITALPKAKHERPEWRLAAAMLMQAAEDGAPVMLAEIAMRRALNTDGKPDPRAPRRKPPQKYKVIR
jgi:class 3 adenylate cyclase